MGEIKTVIITGGNAGLGFACARTLAKDPGYHVILACRDPEKAARAKTALTEETGNPHLEAMELDLSSTLSVRDFVARFKALNLPLFALVCNAGIHGANTGLTPEGFDRIFATNHLGHFLLTLLLFPVIQSAGRIAVVSSDMHSPPGEALTWPGVEALAHPDAAFAQDRVRYSFSKLCNLYFTYELSARLARGACSATVNAFNPGLMVETGFSPDKSRFTPAFMELVADRVGALVRSGPALAGLITDPGLSGVSGQYFDRDNGKAESSPLSHSRENALELWRESARYTGISPGETLPGLL